MMNPKYLSRFGLSFLALTLAACSDGDSTPPSPPAATAKACESESFAALALGNARVVSAAPVEAGAYTPPGSTSALPDLPAFCRIEAAATPSSDSLIEFEVWVPAGGAWNGKLVTTGNGGYSPALSYRDMAYAMRQGYAAIGGDTGHQSADPSDMSWGVGHPEKIFDWGTRSIHAITAPGKRIIEALQGSAPRRAYYYGCSTGGHQGYAEIQRYPQDFDGVIAGAPGNNRTRLNAEFLHRFLSNRVPGTSGPVILTREKAGLITRRAVEACDALDGVTDGVIEDPRVCTIDRFDVASLQCTGADGPDCLTADQVAAAQKIYAGPVNPRTGATIYPGYPVGSESGWPSYWGGTEPVRADYWRQWVFERPDWNWWNFDFDQDLAFAEEKVGSLVDHVDPDVSAFRQRGGKAIVYHGWQDPVVNPLDTIDYVEQVRALQGSQAEMDAFFRLFLVPGMGHCSGGAGATVFGNGGTAPPVIDARHDLLTALDRWVEQGEAPDALIATRLEDGQAVRTRPICAWPKKAVYNGGGSTDDAANFTCR